nr:putative toxin-antitoxin system toxin component, PIN family [Candidatus Eremiobacteraeota bacterium]
MSVRLTVTADTNIYVSALNFGGKPRQLLQAARAGLFDLAVSDPILAEVDRVIRDKFGWEPARVAVAQHALSTFTRRVYPERLIAAVADDPDDNRILECAVASASLLLVSGDKHLLRLEAFEGIRIVTAAAFIEHHLSP